MPLRQFAARVRFLLFAAPALLLAAAPATAAVFTDAAARRIVLPDTVKRVLPAERNAEVLVYVLAPDKLAGLERLPSGRGDGTPRLPALRFRPGATPASVAEAARAFRPDLVLDAGPVTPERVAFADDVQQRTGIPYVMLDDSFERMPSVLQTLGTVLGVPERADALRLFAENAIGSARGGLLIRPAEGRPRVYYALGSDGLTTALPGAPAAAAIAEAGAINVAAPLGRNIYTRISREQLLAWDPDIIIAEYPHFYRALHRDRFWRRLGAVRRGKVYLEPDAPFGWIENPSGVNRLIGLAWLSALFYPEPTHDELRGTVCEFYDKFYRVRLTNARLNNMLALAGIPRPAAPRPVGEPLGLGVAPAAPRTAATPLADFGSAPDARGTVPTLPPELRATPRAPGRPPAAGTIPMIPGTTSGIPGVPNALPLPALPDQADALCTVPGVASPITGLNEPAPPSAGQVPGGRIRQPGGRAPASDGMPPDIRFPSGPER
jgi:iron complex transport system substrate-binding protein